MLLRIRDIEQLSATLRRFTLAPVSGVLPVAGPGAHIRLAVPGQPTTNAYSLSAHSRIAYQIIVRLAPRSRGGSAWLHHQARIGDTLQATPPQNLFPLARLAKHHLLVSAGIGATPFLSYVQTPNLAFTWHHFCKPEDAPAFTRLLPAQIHTTRAPINLATQPLGTHLYLCGPEAFMETMQDTARHLGWPPAKIHMESFAQATGGAPFIAQLARSARTLHIGAEQSLLEALEAAGLAPPNLCRGGVCGACEIPVLAGTPDHRDRVLPADRRATAIMSCVSRALTPELVLDV
jgi:ferredoxin-NADP reductase